jgi:hypothetical protein
MSVAVRIVPVVLAAALVAGAARAELPAPSKAECIAASEAAQDLRKAGKLRDARDKFTVCVADSCPGPVREDCAQHVDEVSKAMPSVVFVVKDAAGNDVGGVKITLDGQPLAASVSGAIELDPGEHTFVLEAPGLTKVEKKFVVVEGVKERREMVRMGGTATPEPATPTSVPAKDDAPARPIGVIGPPTLTWTAFGVGGAGLVLGVVAGLVASGKHSTLQSECGVTTCPPSASGDLDGFHSARTWSTAGYVLAGLGAAAGAVLWLTAPKAHGATAQLWFGPASAGIAGRF